MLKISKQIVQNDYQSAVLRNTEQYESGNVKYGEEYVYENQKKDANDIINEFYKFDTRVISVVKRTKVGMDGLMIEVAKNITTHEDDNFAIHKNNVFIITAMSNVTWEDDMKEKSPACFQNNIYHHGKLHRLKSKLDGIKNALIINDEIDNGDKENQVLHLLLKESGILDIDYMIKNNIRLIFVSATMVNELNDLKLWGNKHHTHYMTIPDNYIGHKDFLKMGIVKEYYPIQDFDSAKDWVLEDIIDNYGSDYRIHIIRTDEVNKHFIEKACLKYDIDCKNHTSNDKADLNELFEMDLTKHVVIIVKGLFRRANLIPNIWKLKIGATHERYSTICDTNVQIQGLPGRMSGYWKKDIINGHKTGPYRTSINAIEEYEKFYENPFNDTYKTYKTFLSPHNIKNLLIDTNDKTNKRIPIIINITDFDIFRLTKRIEKIDYINKVLANIPEFSRLKDYINNKEIVCQRIFEPKSKSSYKTYISDVVDAANDKIPFCLNLPSELKEKNYWQLYIDKKHMRLCFIIWCNNYEFY
jgi:hypothetical protein